MWTLSSSRAPDLSRIWRVAESLINDNYLTNLTAVVVLLLGCDRFANQTQQICSLDLINHFECAQSSVGPPFVNSCKCCCAHKHLWHNYCHNNQDILTPKVWCLVDLLWYWFKSHWWWNSFHHTARRRPLLAGVSWQYLDRARSISHTSITAPKHAVRVTVVENSSRYTLELCLFFTVKGIRIMKIMYRDMLFMMLGLKFWISKDVCEIMITRKRKSDNSSLVAAHLQ